MTKKQAPQTLPPAPMGKVIDKTSKFHGKKFALEEDGDGGYRTVLPVYHGKHVIFLKKQIKLL